MPQEKEKFISVRAASYCQGHNTMGAEVFTYDRKSFK